MRDQGADFVLTQLFFDNDDFFEFREFMVKKLAVNVPICPGILPVLSSNQIKKFTTICGAKFANLHLYQDGEATGRPSRFS